MNSKNIKGLRSIAVLICVTTIMEIIKKIMEVNMVDMTNMEIIKSIIEIGITPVLLLVFVSYFLQKSKGDDQRVKEAYQDAQSKIEETNRSAREHESIMLSESVKREELIRQESEKRESMLMLNMEKITDSMNSITKTLDKIENSFSGIENRLEKIEHKVGKEKDNG